MLEREKKSNGAFYTSEEIARYLVRRVIAGTNQTILEPSFGEGSFIDAIVAHYTTHNAVHSLKEQLYGVEIQESVINEYAQHPLLDRANIILGDFLALEPFPVDLVIGNPPYVGLNRLRVDARRRAKHLLQLHGFKMQSSGSLWFPFVLHSCAFLVRGGTIAFVLPFEVTYVRYAQQLWRFLSEHFEELVIVRVFEDMFPEVDVETVLLIARGYGGSTNFVNYELYFDKASLFENRLLRHSLVSVEPIVNGDRPFVSNLLDRSTLNIIYKLRSKGIVQPISRFCKFKIGYVSADKDYFHPTTEVADKFGLLGQELLPAVANAKALKGYTGLSIEAGSVDTRLFYPAKGNLSAGAQRYVEYGESVKVDRRYKCRKRTPWYITPGIEVPDVILTVFGDKPRLYINEGHYIASNSLLCGFMQDKSVSTIQVAASWYNTLTLLSIELRVHSLGGGVLVFIPGEADAIEVIDPRLLHDLDDGFSIEMNNLLTKGRLEEAYLFGDSYMQEITLLTNQEMKLLREAVKSLRKWRNAKLRKQLELEE